MFKIWKTNWKGVKMEERSLPQAVSAALDASNSEGAGALERVRDRADALEAMMTRLLTVLVDGGKLTADELDTVLDGSQRPLWPSSS